MLNGPLADRVVAGCQIMGRVYVQALDVPGHAAAARRTRQRHRQLIAKRHVTFVRLGVPARKFRFVLQPLIQPDHRVVCFERPHARTHDWA